MKKIYVLAIAVVLNALGQSLMAQTEFGMTAWGMAAVNLRNFANISLGMSFIVLSVFSYIVASLIRKRFDWIEMIQSFLFLFAFGLLTDLFVSLIPNLSMEILFIRFVINFVGLFILLFSIALHIKVGIAIHPMDVYLKEIQKIVKSVRYGTYISYSSAFILGTLFGLLHGVIEGVHIGTVYALLLSGLLFDLNNKVLLKRVHFDSEEKEDITS